VAATRRRPRDRVDIVATTPVSTHADAAARSERAEHLQALLAHVHSEPWAHDFFALLRRIDALRPQAPRTGQTQRPSQEALRLAQQPELDFAPAALAALQPRNDLAPRLLVRFAGLLGPQGPMPLHLTEHVRGRAHQHGDSTTAHFLDLFHHRALGLFYRAWAQAQPTVHLDRPDDDRYLSWLGAVAGLPPARHSLPAHALAFHAGQLASRSRHPEALCKVLRDYFDVPVAIEQHVGQWLRIERSDRSRIGYAGNRAERSGAAAAQLGRNANAGSRAWDRQYRFRLHLGPLTRAQYHAFLPGGSAWRPLADWVRLLAGPDLVWELQLTLEPRERPLARPDRSVQLGVTSWLARPCALARSGMSASERPCALMRPHAAAAPVRQHLRIRPRTSFLARRAGA
jgi:type VI secretion system protein ImpH